MPPQNRQEARKVWHDIRDKTEQKPLTKLWLRQLVRFRIQLYEARKLQLLDEEKPCTELIELLSAEIDRKRQNRRVVVGFVGAVVIAIGTMIYQRTCNKPHTSVEPSILQTPQKEPEPGLPTPTIASPSPAMSAQPDTQQTPIEPPSAP